MTSDMELVRRAKALRTRQTDAELRLWYHLRGRRFMNLKFRRQVPLGRYIVDFLCTEHRLIVEVDGGQHNEHPQRDQQRDRWLAEQGYRVVRFWNHQVMQELDAVLERLRTAAGENPHP